MAWPGGGFFEFLDPFSDWFSSFCDSRNTGFYRVFLFSACLTASFKTSKNLVNYAVLCYGVNENIVNTSVFWRWLKNTVNYSVFGHLTLKNHGICSGFCFSPRKNTVNNSNFAVFSPMFFVIFWTALVRYAWLSNSSRFFSPTISTFGCFWSQWPTSLAVTSGREGVRTTSLSPTMRCWRLPSRSDVNKHQKTHQNQWHAIGYNCVFVSQPMSELHAGIVQVRTIIRVTILSDCFYHGRDRIRLVFWATWAFPDIQRKMLRDVERCWEMLRDLPVLL